MQWRDLTRSRDILNNKDSHTNIPYQIKILTTCSMQKAANSRCRGTSDHAAYQYHGVWHLPHPISEESVLLLHFHIWKNRT